MTDKRHHDRRTLTHVGWIGNEAESPLIECRLHDVSQSGAKPWPTGQVVLAVDDQPDVRTTAVAQLKSLGYQVIEADCAKAALDKLAGGANIDLLFTDIVMPGGINGIELARLARVQRPGLKVLYTSGYPGAGIVDGAQANIDGALLTKPYRRRDLAAAIAEVLEAV